jgi:hypothetical protein
MQGSVRLVRGAGLRVRKAAGLKLLFYLPVTNIFAHLSAKREAADGRQAVHFR